MTGLRPGGHLLIADLRPIRGLSVHQVPVDVVERVNALVTGAGFRITDTGTRRPRLYYLRADRRPV
jgi:hypothetical protein